MQRIRKKKLQPKFTTSFELQKAKPNTPFYQSIGPKPMIPHIPTQSIGRININYSQQNNDMLVSEMLERCGQRRLGFGSLAESIGKQQYQVREMAQQILQKGLNFWIQMMNSVEYRGLFGQKYQWELGDVGSVVNKMLTNRKNKHKKQVYIKLRQNCAIAERYLRFVNNVPKFSTEKINQVLDLMTQVWRWEYRDQLEDFNDNTNLTSGQQSDYIYKQEFNPIVDDRLKEYHPEQKEGLKKQSVIHFDIQKKQFYQQEMDDLQEKQKDKQSSLSVQELSQDSNHFRVNLPQSVAEKLPNKTKQQYEKLQNYDKGPIFKDQFILQQKYTQTITSEFFTQEQHVNLCELYCLFGNNFELISKKMLLFIKKKLKDKPLTKQDWHNITKKVQPSSIQSQLLYLFQSGIQIMKAYIQGYDQFKETLQSTFGLTSLMFYLDAVVNSQFLLEKIMNLETQGDFDNTDKVHLLMTEQLNRDFSTVQQMRDFHVATADFDNIMGIIQLNFDRIVGQNYLLDMLNYVIDSVKDEFHEPIDDDQESAKSTEAQPKFQAKFEAKFEPGQVGIKMAKQQFINNIKKQVKRQGGSILGPIPWKSQDEVIILDD